MQEQTALVLKLVGYNNNIVLIIIVIILDLTNLMVFDTSVHLFPFYLSNMNVLYLCVSSYTEVTGYFLLNVCSL